MAEYKSWMGMCPSRSVLGAMLLQILDNGNEVLNETNNELAKCMAIRSVISDVNLILSVTGTIQCYSKTATCL